MAPEGLVHLEGAFGQIRRFEGELAQRHTPRALLETAPALEETAELAMELAVRQLPAAQVREHLAYLRDRRLHLLPR